MTVQNVAFLGTTQINNTQKSIKKAFVKNPIEKPDSFEKKTPVYDRGSFEAELGNYKRNDGFQKYQQMYIQEILNNVDKNPDKYKYVKEMASLPNMKDEDLLFISYATPERLEVVNEFSKIKDEKGNPKYSSSGLLTFSHLNVEELNKIKPMTETSMSAEQITSLTDIENLDFQKLSQKVKGIEKANSSKGIDRIIFRKDVYEPNKNYVLTVKTSDGEGNSELLDKDLNRIAIEKSVKYTGESGKNYLLTKTSDLRNNTTSQVRQVLDDYGYPSLESQVRIVKDKNGKKQKTEYMTLSDVKGVYNAKTVYPDGRVEETSSGKIDKKTGIVSVKHDMKSLDGTRTQYLYENDPQGNRIIDYKITDEKGKTLLNYSQSLEVLDENHFVSSKNGEVYEMSLSEDKNTLTVKDRKTKEENQINLGEFVKNNKDSMVNLLKKFPGEELIKLKDTTKLINGVEKIDNCSFSPMSKTMNVMDNLYSALHELGHAKDNKNKMDEITNRKDVQDVYNKEKDAFNKAFPNAQKEHINYFIDMESHYNGPKGGLEETIAESNALLNTYNDTLDIAPRAHYLRQYFPKTIAKLAECLSE